MQKTAKLRNGQVVKEGDKVRWIDSDGNQHFDIVKRRKYRAKSIHHGEEYRYFAKATLFLCNAGAKISSYNAYPCGVEVSDD